MDGACNMLGKVRNAYTEILSINLNSHSADFGIGGMAILIWSLQNIMCKLRMNASN